MTTILKKFEDEITHLFKAYRMAHFSLYNMKTTFYNFKCSHPNLENFILEDRDFDSEVKFNEEEIQNNSEDGLYQRIIAGNTIAMFYNIWEDKYRGIIAKRIGCKKNEIKSNFFSELNLIRQSITHNNYNAITALNDLADLNFIGNSESLKLSSYEVQIIYEKLLEEITTIKKTYPI